jgi:hypothetical protein
MLRLTFIVLATGLIALEAQAQTTPKTSAKSATKSSTAKPADDWGWGTPSSTKASSTNSAKPSTKPAATGQTGQASSSAATTETAPASTSTDAANPAGATGSNASGGGFGNYGGADRDAGGSEGMSVAPGRPLLPASGTRSDYMGRPIKSKPSMRPRSVDYDKPSDLLTTSPNQQP